MDTFQYASLIRVVSTVLLFLLLAIFLGFMIRGYFHMRKLKKDDITERIVKISDTLALSSTKLSELQSELNMQIDIYRQIKEEANESAKLLGISLDHAEVVKLILKKELKNDGRRNFWMGIITNLIFFVLGIVVSSWV